MMAVAGGRTGRLVTMIPGDTEVPLGSGTLYLNSTGRAAFSATQGDMVISGGSVVGLGFVVETAAFVANHTFTLEARVNNTVVLTTSVIVTGAGFFKSFVSQDPGIDIVSPNSLIQLSVAAGAATGTTVTLLGAVELELNVG